MKHAFYALIIILLSIFGTVVSASGDLDDIGEAHRLIVVAGDRGIHYSGGCGFYELRDTMAGGLKENVKTNSVIQSPVYEIFALGPSGVSKILIGDHQISFGDRVVVLDTKTYSRIVEMIENRRGQGTPKSKINAKINSLMNQYADPTYKEDNKCTKRS